MTMNVEPMSITIRELVTGYHDDGEGGVVGYDGKLDIRPPYQREFVYDQEQRDKVIESVLAGFPLNVMYWSVRDDGTYEIIDGQQRTISIGQYVTKKFSLKDGRFFHSRPKDEQEKILNYKLDIYKCDGSDSERMDWYETINIAGEVLEKQELRNAVYHGSWVTDAKRYFSRPGHGADNLEYDYLTGEVKRQKYLETVIKWAVGSSDEQAIRSYMGLHRHDENAKPLWDYFLDVIEWVEDVFPTYRKQMRGVDWGALYNGYHGKVFYSDSYDDQIEDLLANDDVIQSGIYPYIITGDRRHIVSRTFKDSIKRRVFKKQGGICVHCKGKFKLQEMEPDHITPYKEGGWSNEENCQMLCIECNRTKGAR